MRDVMDAGADPIEQVVCRHDEVGGHFSVFALGPGMGAIFAVAGDVENRAQAPSASCRAFRINFSEPA
jgi:hypothetical protein